MTMLSSRFKGLLIALVVFALSAGVAFAGSPASKGLSTAAGASGKTVPVSAAPAGHDQDEEVDEETDEPDETDETEDASDNCATDPTGLTEEQLAEMTHGSIVCWAAHQETPDGYDNHGAFVSEWARKGTGGEAKTPDAHAADGLSHKGQGKANRP